MSTHLVVTHPFADYERGAQITDPDTVEQVLATHRHHVVPVVPSEADDGEGPLEDRTVADLKAYAEEHGFDLGDARRKEDILAAISLAADAEAQALAEANTHG